MGAAQCKHILQHCLLEQEGGFAQRHVKKRGRRYSREKTACLHPPPLLAYVELGFKPETFKSTTSLSLPLRPLPPRGAV